MIVLEPQRLSTSKERTMSIWTHIEAEIASFHADIRDLPVLPHVTPSELRRDLEQRYTFERPIPLPQLTQDVMRLLRQGTLHVTHPRYFGLFNPSVHDAGVVADTLVALYNPQLAVWSHAPAANEIERLTLRRFLLLLGFHPDHAIAHYTSGGAEANLSAVLAALAHYFPETAAKGIRALTVRPAIYLTSESHHSFVKIARMTGLGTDCLREVPTSAGYTLDPEALARRIAADLRAGWQPLMIVGTAGTTGAGLVDPLPRLADVAAQAGAWLHVDAAWGGSAVLSPRLRPLLAGIERADSITWDAHKWLSIPMGAGMFFCRHPEAVKRAFAVSTSYMPMPSDEASVDHYATSAQWSRRLIGLKVFMALAQHGIDGYARLIEQQAEMGDVLRERLRSHGWEVINQTQLPVICFSHPDIRAGKLTTGAILQQIYQRNRVWISDVVLGGNERVLRACITSFHTNKHDIHCLIQELEYARRIAGVPS
jgi:glutamate/tyrosine decarboxylase-like PLP-dependent enzyme